MMCVLVFVLTPRTPLRCARALCPRSTGEVPLNWRKKLKDPLKLVLAWSAVMASSSPPSLQNTHPLPLNPSWSFPPRALTAPFNGSASQNTFFPSDHGKNLNHLSLISPLHSIPVAKGAFEGASQAPRSPACLHPVFAGETCTPPYNNAGRRRQL